MNNDIDIHTADTNVEIQLTANRCCYDVALNVTLAVTTVAELDAVMVKLAAMRAALANADTMSTCTHVDGDVNCSLTTIGV